MNINEIVKKHLINALNESLGVPNNIINVAQFIYHKLYDELTKYSTIEELKTNKIIIKEDFSISDYKFNEVIIDFDFIVHTPDEYIDEPGINISKLETTVISKLENLRLVTINKFDVGITFIYHINDNKTYLDFLKNFKEGEINNITSIAHELKHKYDNFKKDVGSLKNRINYHVYGTNGFGSKSTNEILYNLYFTNRIENLVRATEIATTMQLKNIKKKEFYDFILKNEKFDRLKTIRDFTFEKFKQNLFDDIEQNKKLLDYLKIDYSNMSKDQIVNKMIELIFINFANWKHEKLMDTILVNPLEEFMAKVGMLDREKQQFIEKFRNNILKFEKNPSKFFQVEIKRMNIIADKVIRKISKLYDFAKNETNESIVNSELWYNEQRKKSKIRKTIIIPKR